MGGERWHLLELRTVASLPIILFGITHKARLLNEIQIKVIGFTCRFVLVKWCITNVPANSDNGVN